MSPVVECPHCGNLNRDGAQFCRHCATPLTSGLRAPNGYQDVPLLAAMLLGQQAAQRVPPRIEQKEPELMNDDHLPETSTPDNVSSPPTGEPPAVPPVFDGRFELRTDPTVPGPVTVADQQPWQRCWSCGSTDNLAGEAYCTNCGAALGSREYHGYLVHQGQIVGEALIATIDPESPACDVLPEVWAVADEAPYTLVVLYDDTSSALELPVDDVTAIQVGIQLAQLLHELHQHGMALGKINPADLVRVDVDRIRLRNARNLHQPEPDQAGVAFEEDLQELGELLETLTGTPRTTRRLNDEAAAALIVQEQQGTASLGGVLRQIRTGELGTAAAVATRLEELLHELSVPAPLMQRVAAASHRGMVRDHNEDSCLYVNLVLNNSSVNTPAGVFVVADGMGGHAAGEVASRLAVQHAATVVMQDYLTGVLDASAGYDPQQAATTLTRAVLRANEAINSEGTRRGNDMGTTITMALVVGDRATIANVGDSRTYLFREGKLRRITRDHSLVMRLVEIGQITEQDIYTHPQRNAVLRSLGDQLDVEVDIFRERLQPGDVLLLCSDGLWEMTHDPEMNAILNRIGDVDTAAQALIDAANKAGGEDNVTVLLVRMEQSIPLDA